MANEVTERLIQRFKQKAAEYRADPANPPREPEPVATIAEIYGDLEALDNEELLALAEDSPTCREILLRRILALTPASATEHRD